jgi:DNA-binding transcriptional ArsR family regulator
MRVLIRERIYCNSSDVEETLDSTPDVSPLEAAGDPIRHRILEELLHRAATQKELGASLKLQSGTLSKHMGKLRAAGLVVQRGGSHGPYEIPLRGEVARLLQANHNFVSARISARAAATEAAGKRLNEAIMRPASSEDSKSETG